MGRFVAWRILSLLLVLVAVTYLSFLAQHLAAATQAGTQVMLPSVAGDAWRDAIRLWRALPSGRLGEYTAPIGLYGMRRTVSVRLLLVELLGHSLGLLALAVLLGSVSGALIGAVAAGLRRPWLAAMLLMLSIVGISTPSFVLGMLLQHAELWLYRTSGVRLLPVGGFGWDEHLLLPVAVLAGRPMAQVARLTHGRVQEILAADYVTTARAKGLLPWRIWRRHILPNAAVTMFTATGTSLRMALSSLPVVELLFAWPGLARLMLDALATGQRHVATVVVLAMGALVLAINLVLEIAYRVVDPRLGQSGNRSYDGLTFRAGVSEVLETVWRTLSLRWWRERRMGVQDGGLALPKTRDRQATSSASAPDEGAHRPSVWRQISAVLRQPATAPGLLLGGALLALVVFGPSWAPPSSYAVAQRLVVDGRAVDPPLPPSALYPLGTDVQGRDLLRLLLAGARRTMSIAALAMLARLALGGILGFLAGWFAGSPVDRMIMSLVEVVAAFPALLLAMLIIYAVGIEQGLMAFVVGLSLIGWGETMQTVRSETLRIKPMAFVESAVATGLTQMQILGGHVLPNVAPTMISLAFLELGGVLMILSELGFLGVFIGRGLAQGEWTVQLQYYDLPEWSVMLAYAWRSFRSYPWMTLFPAGAFLLAILGFSLLGEVLRGASERFAVSMRVLLGRRTALAVVALILGVGWVMRSTSAYATLSPLADGFDPARAMSDIARLSSPVYNGRLTGTPGAEEVADWLTAEFEALGLQPAGETVESYALVEPAPNVHDLTGPLRLVLYGPHGEVIEAQEGRDVGRRWDLYDVGGTAAGDVVIASALYGYINSANHGAMNYGIGPQEFDRQDRLILALREEASYGASLGRSGLLTLADEPLISGRYGLLWQSDVSVADSEPSVLVSREVVERLLASEGRTLAQVEAQLPGSATDAPLYLPVGWRAELRMPTVLRQDMTLHHVLGRWPGEDWYVGQEVVVVSAYYDGLGSSPDGTLYPGANDNASGVATMLEVVRCLKEQRFRPKRTLLFVAWAGGERHIPPDPARFVHAHPAFTQFKVAVALELDGVGAGTGSTATLDVNRQKLTAVLRRSARQVGTRLMLSGDGLHGDPARWPTPSTADPTATVSWAGADELAHLPTDTVEGIDIAKIADVGRLVTLSVAVLGSDPAY